MFIYILILCLLFLLACLDPYLRLDSTKRKLFLFVGCALSVFAGIRYDVGVDYTNYEDLYELSDDLYQMKEIGFIKIIELFNWLGLPFSLFCLCYSLLTVLLVCCFIEKYSPYVYLSLFIYYALGNYFFSSFNAMRQALAVAIFINSLSLVSEKKLWKYSFNVIVSACCVHFSSLILLPLYFLLRKRYATIVKIIVICGTVVLSKFVVQLIAISPYRIYLAFENFASSVPLTFYLIGGIAVFTFLYSLKHPEWEKKHLILSNMNLATMLLLCLLFLYNGTQLVMIFNRILSYFTMIYIVVVPLLLRELYFVSNRKLIIIMISCFFFVLCSWSLMQNGELNNMIPYKTIFNR